MPVHTCIGGIRRSSDDNLLLSNALAHEAVLLCNGHGVIVSSLGSRGSDFAADRPVAVMVTYEKYYVGQSDLTLIMKP